MSRESVSIMCYRGHTNRLIEEADAEIKRKILHLHTLQMFFSMRSTMGHGTACAGSSAAPLRADRTRDTLTMVQPAAHTQILLFFFFFASILNFQMWRKAVLAVLIPS